MLGYFYFRDFQDGVLLTNDTGNNVFLSHEVFADFSTDKLDKKSELWNTLAERGFCYDKSEESYVRFNEDSLRDAYSYLFESTNLFIFAITNKCNNRCVYCQADGILKKDCSMSISVAEQALLRIGECPAHEITIEFQGGEPLLNFDVIRYIVDRSKDVLKKKNVHFALVTNLALLSEEMALFIKENKISVSTSLDGPKFIHDINRPSVNGYSSFEAMLNGKQILENTGIIVGAIETTTAQSIPFPADIVHAYVEHGFSQIFLRPLTRLGAAARSWDSIGYDADAFLVFYRQALSEIIRINLEGTNIVEYQAAIYLRKILRGKAVNYMELRSPCGAGLGQMAITANGDVFTCDEGRMMAEMGDTSFRIGNVFEDHYAEWLHSPNCEAVCSASILDTLPGCCDCVYKPYCGVCPVVNYAIHGNLTHVAKERCKINAGILEILFNYIINGDSDIIDLFYKWSEQV